ncbi:MAG: hypothetical protein ACO20H_13125 [Bacteriovoracaceae bacterium]
MRNILFITLIFASFSTQAANVRKIKNCGNAAERTIEQALDFLDNNINTIINRTGDLKKGEKKKLKKKLSKLNYKCMDHKRVCRVKPDRGGKDRHLFNQAVVICYNNIRTILEDDAFCTLADVLIHETGHSAGVKKDSGHNNGPNNDRVYRLGFAAADLCRELGLDRSIPRNTND